MVRESERLYAEAQKSPVEIPNGSTQFLPKHRWHFSQS